MRKTAGLFIKFALLDTINISFPGVDVKRFLKNSTFYTISIIYIVVDIAPFLAVWGA